MNLFLGINHDKAINKILQEKKGGVSYQKGFCQTMHWHCHTTTTNIMIIGTVIIVICGNIRLLICTLLCQQRS